MPIVIGCICSAIKYVLLGALLILVAAFVISLVRDKGRGKKGPYTD